MWSIDRRANRMRPPLHQRLDRARIEIMTPTTSFRTCSRRRLRTTLIFLLAFATVAQSGCSAMWQRVRERERLYAVQSARENALQAKCEPALNSLDRAQASLELGPFARESTLIRARCYEILGRPELARAHRRLLADFYEKEAIVGRDSDGTEVLRAADVVLEDYGPPPSSLKLKRPRYNSFARRSGLIGRVVVSFDLAGDGKPTRLRVLEMPHPLLATWAIEAVLESYLRKDAVAPAVAPAHYLTILSFEWRWAKTSEAEPDS